MKRALSIPQLPPGFNNLLIAAAAAYVVWQFGRGFNVMEKALEPVAAGAGNLWSDIADIGRGRVELTEARFFLNGKYVDETGLINRQWRANIEQSHGGIPVLFKAITDNYGRLLPQYRHLIDGEVTAATINTNYTTLEKGWF